MVDKKKILLDLYNNLPKRDCGAKDVKDSPCGNKYCVEFSRKLITTENQPEDCSYLTEKQLEAIALILEEYFR
ncbi:MAG: hypothetical protein GF334_13955 [Candidatus Altiarchaeales archaeon]|nr:hypothetical protein [Candidatus Altiarchaeales archaeon]